ncbi:hypothetical protein VTH82DRAFT_6728 [Thermothelomyces myriococcoides]
MMPSPTLKNHGGDSGTAGPPPRETSSYVHFADLLQEPLSQLAQFAHIPLPDIEAFVNRSRATREAETGRGRKKGHIRRPLNAFILYRKCYSRRAAAFCESHAPGTAVNHGSVSSVCGASWKMEPDHVRDRFKDLAAQELRAFQKAFPKYRYQPRRVALLEEVGGGMTGTRLADAAVETLSLFSQHHPQALPPWFTDVAQQGAEYYQLVQANPYPVESLDISFNPQWGGWATQMPSCFLSPAPQYPHCPGYNIADPEVELGTPVSSPKAVAAPEAPHWLQSSTMNDPYPQQFLY